MRIRIFAFLFIVIFFSGCSQKTVFSPEALNDGFSCVVEINYKKTEIKTKLTSKMPGAYCFEIFSPPVLNGLTLDFDGENVTMKYFGISYSAKPENLPETAFADIIKDAVYEASKAKTVNVLKKNGCEVLSGTCKNGKYSLILENGFLKTLSIPGAELTAEFKNTEK